MSVLVRRAVASDAAALSGISAVSFAVPESLAYMEHELANTALTRYLVCCLDDEIIAYGGYWKVLDESQVTNIAVQPKRRGQGYGKQVVAAMLAFAKEEGCTKMLLEVRVSNEPAFQLYTKLGFSVLAVRKDYYTEPVEDAYVMQCDIRSYTAQNIEIKDEE